MSYKINNIVDVNILTDTLYRGAINFRAPPVIEIPDVILPPTDWGPIPSGGGGLYTGNGWGIRISGDTILVAGGLSDNTNKHIASTDGGLTFAITDIPQAAFKTSAAVAINLALGWYLFGRSNALYLSTTSPLTGYVSVHVMSASYIYSAHIADDGRICAVGSGGRMAFKSSIADGGTWVDTLIGTSNLIGVTHVTASTWIIVADAGKAYYTDNDFLTLTILEAGLSSGSTTGNILCVSSNASGIVVAGLAGGFAAYSTNFGAAGSWLPLVRYVGFPTAADVRGVAVSQYGDVVFGGGGGGNATLSNAADFGTFAVLPSKLNNGAATSAGEIIFDVACNSEGKFVASFDTGFLAISPPLGV